MRQHEHPYRKRLQNSMGVPHAAPHRILGKNEKRRFMNKTLKATVGAPPVRSGCQEGREVSNGMDSVGDAFSNRTDEAGGEDAGLASGVVRESVSSL